MADAKTTAARPARTQGGQRAGKPKNSNNFLINFLIVAGCIVAAILIYNFVLGNPANFADGADRHKPKHGNFLATMYTGGVIVPILMATLLTLLVFVVERALTIFKARGKGNTGEFVRKVQYHLANKNIDAALAECDRQSGSVGNVMRSGL